MRKGSGNCVFSEPLYDAHAVFPVPNETFKTELTELGELGGTETRLLHTQSLRIRNVCPIQYGFHTLPPYRAVS